MRKSFQTASRETVWKMPEGFSTAGLWQQEVAKSGVLSPPGGPRNADPGSIPIFQTVSEGEFSEVPPSGLPLCLSNRMAGVQSGFVIFTKRPQHLTLVFDGA